MKMILLVVFALASSVTVAATLKEQKQMKEWNDSMKSDVTDPLNKACGTSAAATIDPAMATPFMAENVTVAGSCGDAFAAVRDLCEDETGKASIKKNIRKLECKNGKSDEVTFKLNGGTFSVIMGPKAANLRSKAKTYLENNLK